jgi:hypothetical protein
MCTIEPEHNYSFDSSFTFELDTGCIRQLGSFAPKVCIPLFEGQNTAAVAFLCFKEGMVFLFSILSSMQWPFLHRCSPSEPGERTLRWCQIVLAREHIEGDTRHFFEFENAVDVARSGARLDCRILLEGYVVIKLVNKIFCRIQLYFAVFLIMSLSMLWHSPSKTCLARHQFLRNPQYIKIIYVRILITTVPIANGVAYYQAKIIHYFFSFSRKKDFLTSSEYE